MNIKNPQRKVTNNPSVIFLRKCHLPLHKRGKSCVRFRTGRRRAPTPTEFIKSRTSTAIQTLTANQSLPPRGRGTTKWWKEPA